MRVCMWVLKHILNYIYVKKEIHKHICTYRNFVLQTTCPSLVFMYEYCAASRSLCMFEKCPVNAVWYRKCYEKSFHKDKIDSPTLNPTFCQRICKTRMNPYLSHI